MKKQYIPFKIDQKNAQKNLAKVDWPEMFAEQIQDLTYEKLLLPFDIYDNRCLAEESFCSRIKNLTIPEYLSRDQFSDNIHIDNATNIVECELSEYNVYLPFWHIFSKDNKSSSVLIDGYSGKIITGCLQAASAPAYERCLFFTGLFILLSFIFSTFILEMTANMFEHKTINISNLQNNSNTSFIFTILGICTLIIFTTILRNYFFTIIKEPLIRVDHKLIYYPLSEKWKDFLQIIAILFLGSSLWTIFLVSILSNFIKPQISFTVFIHIIISLLIFIIAAYLSKDRMTLFVPEDDSNMKKVKFESEFSKLIKLCLEVSLYTLAGSLTGKIIVTSGLSLFTSNNLLSDSHFLITQCGAIGTYLGIFVSEMSHKFKFTLLAAMIAEEIGCSLFGEWIGMIFGITAIVISSYYKSQTTDQKLLQKDIFKKSLYLAWYFLLFQILGRVILITIGTFLLGVDGMVLGEMLGEKIGSTIGFIVGWKKLNN